jgi:hypothetical protein
MFFATTSTRSNKQIFVPENNGSPNNDLFRHISKLGSITRLDFERCSIAGEVIYIIEGDVSPISQQDEEARIGTLTYAIKKLGRENQASVQQSVKSAYPAPKGRAFGVLPRKSRTYRQYLKSLNKIDRELLNEAVRRRLSECDRLPAGKKGKQLSIQDARALLRVEEWSEIRDRARNIAWAQFAPEEAFDPRPSEAALKLSDCIANLQEVVQPRAVLASKVLIEFIKQKTGFFHQGGPIPETMWKKLNSTEAQRLKELNDYVTSAREDFYRGFETIDKLRRRLKKAGDSGSSPSTPNLESSGQTPSIPEEIRREPHPAEDAAEFMRCLNIICNEGDALSRQATASYYYNEMTHRKVSDVLKEMGLLAMELQGLNPIVEVKETEMVDVANEQSDSIAASDSEDDSDFEERQSLFDQEVADVLRIISGRRKAAWIEEPDDALREENLLEQYDEGGAIVTMSSHERTVACGYVDPEYSADDLPQCAQHLATQLRRDYANGTSISQIRADIDAELETIFPVSIENDEGQTTFISYANVELQRFAREVLEAILDECRQDFHLSALHSHPLYRSFHKAIRGASDTRTVSNLMKRAYHARQSGFLPVKHFISLNTASKLHRERLLSAPLSRTAFRLIKEINTASAARLKYFAWAFYGDNQPSNPVHSLLQDETSRVWAALKQRQRLLMIPNKAA